MIPAVLCHLYYYDTWPDLARYIRNVPQPFELHVNVAQSDNSGGMIQRVREEFPQATVYTLPNLGRDIWPLIFMLGQLSDEVGPWACIHGKKSVHVRNRRSGNYGERWRRELLDPIMGSQQAVKRAIDAIERGEGMVAARRWVYPVCQMESYAGRDRLLAAICADKPAGDFVAGTMFWACRELANKVLSWGLTPEDFHAHKDLDLQLEHTIERMLGVALHHHNLSIYRV